MDIRGQLGEGGRAVRRRRTRKLPTLDLETTFCTGSWKMSDQSGFMDKTIGSQTYEELE